MLTQLDSNDFRPWIGKTCRAFSDELSLDLVIVSVDENRRPNQPPDLRIPFSVLFKSLEKSDFRYGICTLELAAEQTIPTIYIERTIPPLGANPDEAYYQSIFN